MSARSLGTIVLGITPGSLPVASLRVPVAAADSGVSRLWLVAGVALVLLAAVLGSVVLRRRRA